MYSRRPYSAADGAGCSRGLLFCTFPPLGKPSPHGDFINGIGCSCWQAVPLDFRSTVAEGVQLLKRVAIGFMPVMVQATRAGDALFIVRGVGQGAGIVVEQP